MATATKETATVKLQNKGKRVYCIGEIFIIPGGDPVEVAAADLNHFEIVAAIKSGNLVQIEEKAAEAPAESK